MTVLNNGIDFRTFESESDRQRRLVRKAQASPGYESMEDREKRLERQRADWICRQYDQFLAQGGRLPFGVNPPVEWVLRELPNIVK